MKRWLCIVLLCMNTVAIAIQVVEFENPEQELRYKTLIAQLRCLVCQNQNLADSNAELAVDLKEIVHQKILAGETDQQILDFMTQRYGDFVLYRPPFKSKTILLWLGPALFLLIGVVIARIYIKKTKAQTFSPSPAQREQVKNLLDE